MFTFPLISLHQNPDLFFSDGVRKIDFVVVWDATIPSNMTPQSAEKRFIFENNLEKEGLELESTTSHGGMLHFIKVHAPDEVLRRYAEILKLRMPMKQVQDLISFNIHMPVFTLNNIIYIQLCHRLKKK